MVGWARDIACFPCVWSPRFDTTTRKKKKKRSLMNTVAIICWRINIPNSWSIGLWTPLAQSIWINAIQMSHQHRFYAMWLWESNELSFKGGTFRQEILPWALHNLWTVKYFKSSVNVFFCELLFHVSVKVCIVARVFHTTVHFLFKCPYLSSYFVAVCSIFIYAYMALYCSFKIS